MKANESGGRLSEIARVRRSPLAARSQSMLFKWRERANSCWPAIFIIWRNNWTKWLFTPWANIVFTGRVPLWPITIALVASWRAYRWNGPSKIDYFWLAEIQFQLHHISRSCEPFWRVSSQLFPLLVLPPKDTTESPKSLLFHEKVVSSQSLCVDTDL